MRRILLGALLGTAAIVPGTAMAQSPECDRLVTMLEQNQGAQMPIDIERARTLQRDRNEAECVTVLQQVQAQAGQQQPAQAQAGQPAESGDANAVPEAQEGAQPGQEASGSNIVVQQPAPTVSVEQAAPQVTVQQPQPNVTVRQPQPEIIVRQPAPVVTIDIPQPEIIVRMPDPEVIVQQAQPTVQVQQAQPQVRVEQPEQPQVQVQEAPAPQVQLAPQGEQAPATVERTGEPRVTFERAEPQVTINQAEGQPTIRMEPMEGQQPPPPAGAAQADSQDPNRTPEAQEGQPAMAVQPGQDSQDPNATPEAQEGQQQQAAATQGGQQQPAAGGQMQRVAVADFDGMDVINERGEDIGEVEGIVQSAADGKRYVVIENGGFLGIGENRVALSLEGLMVRGEQLVVPGLTDDELRALPKFEASDQYPEVEDAEVEVRAMAAQ